MARPTLLRVSRSTARSDSRPCAEVVVHSSICARVASRDTPADASAVSWRSVRLSQGTKRAGSLRDHATFGGSGVMPRVLAGRFALAERRWRRLKYLLLSSSGT